MANEAKSNDTPKVPQDDIAQAATNQSQDFTRQQNEINKILKNSNTNRNFRRPADPRPNPLSKFASYTYQATLYMVTPDAYEAFILSGRQNINALRPAVINGNTSTSGAYVVAQSGGINDKDLNRAPGMEFDYYIDDLKITSIVSGKLTQTSSAISDISFTIIEPYGFSFITRLARAQQQIINNSKVKNIRNNANQFKQFFILGIRFQGYDEAGKIINPQTIFSQDTRAASSTFSGVYERFYDMFITEIKYKLGSGATTYNIKGRVIPAQIGLGTKFSTVPFTRTIPASNVQEAIEELLKAMNENEKAIANTNNNKEKGFIPNEYEVRFLPNASEISNAKIKNPADLDKLKTAMTNFNYSEEASEAIAAKSASLNLTKQNISFNQGISIAHTIQRIISQSEYLEKALKVIYSTANQPNQKTKQPNEVVKDDVPDVKWYNCGVEVKCLGFDTVRQDWSYRITYVIQPYETPATFSAFTKSTNYYGPVKRYRYWFTGQNSEILSFEQTLNNNYYMVALTGNETGEGSGTGIPVPLATGQAQNEDPQGSKNLGAQARNAYLTNLFDPTSIAKSKIRILGDPDFLVMESPESINQVYNQFYSNNGFTINATGGDVFIEIDFNEAVDYDNNIGILNINESIMIWPYPPEIAAVVKGVSFQVGSVISTFNKGIFQQELNLFLNQFPAATTTPIERERSNIVNTTPAVTGDVRKDSANKTQENLNRLNINPSRIQGGRGTINPPSARPNSNDDNQGNLPGTTVPGIGNISDFPAA